MAQMIKKESDKELLALGEEQEEIIEEEKEKRNLIFPIILVIVGLILMAIGIFYNNIVGAIDEILNKETSETTIKDDNILTCIKKEENEVLGLNTKTEYTYTFKNKKLKNITETRTIEPMEYSDIGPTNVRVINGQYTDELAKLINVEGIKTTQNLNNNKLVVTININLGKLDTTKIPANDKVEVIYTLDETSKSVKQKIAHSGDILCE